MDFLRVRRGEHGAAAVEFALILPVLIALLGGIIDFGFAFNAQIGLAHAVREGVRVEAIGTGDGGAVADAAFAALAVTPNPAVAEPCPSPPSPSGDRARVTKSASYEFFVLPFGPITLQSEAVMRCGG